MDLYDAMSTLRAVRRLKPDPIPEETIRKLIEAATKAPSGANRQHWRFIVIREPELRRRDESGSIICERGRPHMKTSPARRRKFSRA